MSRRQVRFSHLLYYFQKRERFTAFLLKKLMEDAGVKLVQTSGPPQTRYKPIDIESVRKLLALHHSRTGAKEIRKRQRAIKAAQKGISSSSKPPPVP